LEAKNNHGEIVKEASISDKRLAIFTFPFISTDNPKNMKIIKGDNVSWYGC
jgi:hypothetical protein